MSIWSELFVTEKIVKRAEEFNYQRPPEARSTIRERALRQMVLETERADFMDTRASERALESLSPGLRAVEAQRLSLRVGAEQRLRQQIAAVRAQDAAADADDRAFARMSPLKQARYRDGWYRVTDLDRTAAIAGLLRRERLRGGPLTREATGRAKSIDAARRDDPYVVSTADLQSPVDNSDLIDPCVEYRLIAARRRETFFAKGLVIRGGYPGARRYSRSPC